METLDEKIYGYIITHPWISAILIPVFLGIAITFLIGFIKMAFDGDSKDYLDETQLQTKNTLDNYIWRSITFIASVSLAILVLSFLGEFIVSWELRIMFVVINTSIPFFFFHYKGKQIIKLVVGGLFTFFKNLVKNKKV